MMKIVLVRKNGTEFTYGRSGNKKVIEKMLDQFFNLFYKGHYSKVVDVKLREY